MRQLAAVALALMVTGLCAFGAEKDGKKGGGANWMNSLTTAQAEAKTADKPVLALFTGSDWCAWCVKLEKEVFSKPEFAEWAGKTVVLAKLDFPRRKKQSAELKAANKAAAEKYQVGGFPTVVFLSAQGEVLGQMGYERGGPAAWTQKAQKLLAKQ